jgi:maleylacetate reductase
MTVSHFIHEALPARVVFGRGTLRQLPEEADRLKLERILVVSTAAQDSQAYEVARRLESRVAAVFPGAVMHTPTEVTDTALDLALARHVDGVVAIGGGSAVGLSKAIALRTDLPQLVIPTTYAGSEATPILGETNQGEKITQRSMKVLPESILYDVDLTMGLPVSMSMTSGLNAMAHAAEALYSPDRNPLIDLMAEAGLGALIFALPRIRARSDDVEGRSDALYGAWMCGSCLGSVGMALHHKICHTLGGTFGLPHAEMHAVMLPHTLAYNLAAVPDVRERLARLFGQRNPIVALEDFARGLGVPRALRDLGMPEEGIGVAADLAVKRPYPNPRPIEREAVRAMLARAWAGDFPESGESAA